MNQPLKTSDSKFKIRLLIVFGAIVLVLLITNPTLKDFQESGHNYNSSTYTLREANYLLFSKYRCERHGGGKTYWGVLKNFYETD